MNDWISRNNFLSEEDKKHNAVLVFRRLSKHGFSTNAISAIVANMEAESTINPGIWEGLQPYIGGYGLVQWTPYEKYSDWAGDDWQNNGDKECDRIAHEFDIGIQFYMTDLYPITAQEFKVGKQPPEYLALAFMHNYERPASYVTEEYRKSRARDWYNLFSHLGEEETPEEPHKPQTKREVHTAWLLSHHG